MKVTLITVGNKMPDWAIEAKDEFAKRLQEFTSLHCIEIPLQKRNKTSDLSRILEKEEQHIRAAIPSGARCIALDKSGKQFASESLASHLEKLQHHHTHLCFIIGGPEGLQPQLLKDCEEKWSLSLLTFPHALARVILLETLYRSWSILQNHPYHK
jgi:23S rRNA (pseudouridine1915-N3)-methyltransferase